jgi:hypothetical protein
VTSGTEDIETLADSRAAFSAALEGEGDSVHMATDAGDDERRSLAESRELLTASLDAGSSSHETDAADEDDELVVIIPDAWEGLSDDQIEGLFELGGMFASDPAAAQRVVAEALGIDLPPPPPPTIEDVERFVAETIDRREFEAAQVAEVERHSASLNDLVSGLGVAVGSPGHRALLERARDQFMFDESGRARSVSDAVRMAAAS